jgi:UDP-GlcNAc3NAcA epimerase
MIKIATIVGARPQFIKAAAVSRAIAGLRGKKRQPGIREIVIHTGQHYDDNMSRVFFEELGIPEREV